MSHCCGIDLGTTNSCIALVQDGMPVVLADNHGRNTLPSVAFRDKAGHCVIGHGAIARIGQLPAPVSTVKRKMGSDQRVVLGGAEATPIEVSALILKHLKVLAEEAARTPVDKAVVTVPAYFNFRQKQDTEMAAQQAGFREVLILQEPVAAALAYCVNQGEGALTVLAYDLGGGTFDATVLERTVDNEINVLAFGGDANLGGDDFDALIAEHVRRTWRASGAKVDWDLTQPEGAAQFQKLKHLAEIAKIQLSSEAHAVIDQPASLRDTDGETVDLHFELTRAELERIIGPLLDKTIEFTRETLARSGLQMAQIDRLIMVGGSSYIPRIRNLLSEAFGKTPELIDPETIVAVGAAIKAASSFGHYYAGQDIELQLDFPPVTPESTLRLAGRLSHAVNGWTVTVFSGDDEVSRPLDGDRFLVDGIALRPDDLCEIVLLLEDNTRAERLQATLEVRQDSNAKPMRAPDALIAKPLSVRTIHGLEVVIDAGARLPIRAHRTFHTEDQSGAIRVPIVEGMTPIGEVVLTEVPNDLPIGSVVDIELAFNRDYSVGARAKVTATGQEARARFEIPQVKTHSPARVQERLASSAARWKAATALGADGDAERYSALRSGIEEELRAPEPKLAKISEELNALESVLVAAEAEALALGAFQPPLDEAMKRLDEIDKRLAESARDDRAQLQASAADARATLRTSRAKRDLSAWREAMSRVTLLDSATRSRIEDMPIPAAREMLVDVARMLEEILQSQPAARRTLGDLDPRLLIVRGLEHPHEALNVGFAALRRLVDAGLLDLGSDDSRTPSTTAAPRSSSDALRGLLGARAR